MNFDRDDRRLSSSIEERGWFSLEDLARYSPFDLF